MKIELLKYMISFKGIKYPFEKSTVIFLMKKSNVFGVGNSVHPVSLVLLSFLLNTTSLTSNIPVYSDV